MKTKISLVALATALSMGASFAADLPSRKAPVYVAPPPPPTLWTGFYAGLNAGYDWGISTNSQTVAGGLYDNYANGILGLPFGSPGAMALANSGNANVNRSGFIGGGQIGYNYQWGPSFVVGLEADIQGAGIRGNGSFTGAAADSAAPFSGHSLLSHHQPRLVRQHHDRGPPGLAGHGRCPRRLSRDADDAALRERRSRLWRRSGLRHVGLWQQRDFQRHWRALQRRLRGLGGWLWHQFVDPDRLECRRRRRVDVGAELEPEARSHVL